jgi:hypothetical protein
VHAHDCGGVVASCSGLVAPGRAGVTRKALGERFGKNHDARPSVELFCGAVVVLDDGALEANALVDLFGLDQIELFREVASVFLLVLFVCVWREGGLAGGGGGL